jgi:hypothetical protein
VEALRRPIDLAILTGATAAYPRDDARRIVAHMAEVDVGWLEEPFPGYEF